jgi:hypothetical protein
MDRHYGWLWILLCGFVESHRQWVLRSTSTWLYNYWLTVTNHGDAYRTWGPDKCTPRIFDGELVDVTMESSRSLDMQSLKMDMDSCRYAWNYSVSVIPLDAYYPPTHLALPTYLLLLIFSFSIF